MDLVHSVSPEVRTANMSAFVMHDLTWQHIRTLVDADNRFFIGDLSNGADLRLLGYPVIVDNAMPQLASAAKPIVFGAIEDAFIVRHTDARFKTSEDFAFAEDERAFRAVLSLDSKVVDDTAIRALEMS